MIARLRGILLEKAPGRVVVDVGGVGYEVLIPLSTYSGIGDPGGRVELHIHTHVREETLSLYGFGTQREKGLFARLIAIGGIGPKTAIAILSGIETEDLVAAVRRRDAARLASVPGVGRKTAERILVDLGDRIEEMGEPGAAGAAEGDGAALRQDLVSALVNLGYNARVASDAATRALRDRSAGAGITLESLLRQTLRTLSR